MATLCYKYVMAMSPLQVAVQQRVDTFISSVNV
jgi:hypothetical protein